ncbi:MAG: DUF418 domain-containing transporter [Myxococcales bacterium]|nr:DUF418 domain-containing transporter [Myxococcales bacterium]
MSRPAGARLLSLDALRGLAVFLMMEQHMGVWLYHRAPGTALPTHLVAFNALGGAAAPLFITLAGVGTSLSLRRPGRGDLLLLRRGLVLLGFGYLLNLLTPSWFTLRSWFVLHMMGVAIMTAPLWRRMSSRALLATAALVIAATAPLQHWLGTPRMLSNDRMALKPPFEALAGGHLRVAFAEGQFPIFPWLSMFLVGMVVGRIVGDTQGDPEARARALRRLAVGAVLLGVGLALLGALGKSVPALAFARAEPWRRLFGLPLGFFPATAAIVVLLQSVVLWLIVIATWIESRAPWEARSWIVALGRISLTLLLVHVVVFRELTRPVGLWQALDAEAALAVIGLWTILCAVIARAWQKHGYRYGAEWLLRRVAG